jgi:2-keto-4-pentenoate hydratase/2-oxohepta-3-ene-1,7-dioic acid hydratase in catechol pathway
MKLASFIASGTPSYGVVAADGIIDMGRRLGAPYPTLRSALAADLLGAIAAAAKHTEPDYVLAAVKLEPPIPAPDKIVCIGLNYKAHAEEVGRALPKHPSLFLRLTNTLVAHEGELIRPALSEHFDFEGELAVVIGKGGRNIARADALDHVAGYSCFNDGSLRDYQYDHSLAVGKNFHATGGFGPWLATADEIPDPSQLTLTTRLNGAQVQNGKTDDMIFDVPAVVAYVSAFTPLEAGDVLVTGTPPGVGHARKPPLWMKPGDMIEVEISGIGVLRHTVVAEGA